MDFGFSEEQRDVQNLARTILNDLVTPESLASYDEYQGERFDRTLWAKLAASGLLGIAVAETHGGMGFGYTELALFIEEIGRSIAPVPAIPHLVSAMLPIQQFGSAALQSRWLPSAVSGEVLLTAALMEDGEEHPDVPRRTTAITEGSGYRINGEKLCVPFAAQADRVLVAAACDGGVLVALVDPKAAGVSLSAMKVTTFEPQYRLVLKDVSVAAQDVLVAPARGAEVMQWLNERTLAAVCAHQLGVTDKALRMTASYTAERKQFGVPIATFQAVGHRAANGFIDVECLRLNTYQAISRLHSGVDATTEVQIAKIWAGDVGHRVSYSAQHLHGGTGIDRDYPLWRYCLWARHNEMMLGSSARQLAELGQRIAGGAALCR